MESDGKKVGQGIWIWKTTYKVLYHYIVCINDCVFYNTVFMYVA